MGFELAQVNVARTRAPLDSPQMAGFVAAIDPVLRLAEQSDGFVWRHVTATGTGSRSASTGTSRW
jgi:hypothetical protein